MEPGGQPEHPYGVQTHAKQDCGPTEAHPKNREAGCVHKDERDDLGRNLIFAFVVSWRDFNFFKGRGLYFSADDWI
jgi:hypothetical protein